MPKEFHKVHRRIEFGDGQTGLDLRGHLPLLIAAKAAALGVIKEKVQLTFDREITEISFELLLMDNLGNYGCPPCVHDLMEVVFLTALYQQIRSERKPNDSDHSPFGLVVLGAMIQQRLTRSLLELPQGSLVELLSFRTELDLAQICWNTAIRGATSAVRVLKGLRMVSGDPIYMATVKEDYVWGVDAFVLVPDTTTGLCLSIATAKWFMEARGELVVSEPLAQEKNILQSERRTAWRGTKQANRAYGLDLTAALIMVRNEERLTTRPSEDELTALRGLLAAAKHRQQNGATACTH